MAKLAAIVLLMVALAASASAYTTVVTTTVTEETNPRGWQSSCKTEMEEKMPMRQCMTWMQKMMRGPYNSDDAFLRSAVANPRFKERAEEELQQCCSEIKQFSSGCRCDAVKEMMSEMPRMEMAEEMVRSLPRMCGISECRM